MATTNQRNRSGGGHQGPAKQSTGRGAMAQAGEAVEDMRDQVAGYVSQGAERFGDMTRGREGQATLIALAAGFGVGLVIGVSLASGHRRPRSWRERVLPEGFAKQLMDRVENMLPDMISEHLRR